MKNKSFRCAHCRRKYPVRRVDRVPKYCNRPECQRVRKREWMRKKMAEDQSYRHEQELAKKLWRENNSDYWKRYRQSNPEYCQKNREKQKERNLRRKKKGKAKAPDFPGKRVNDDNYKGNYQGQYGLIPVTEANIPVIARIDAKLVEIHEISVDYKNLPP